MARPLNPEESASLLNAQGRVDVADLEARAEADGHKRVSAYDFKRPRLFSQDQMRVLQYVHELFARDVSVYLSSQLRTMVEITLTAVDQVQYSEYVASCTPPSALYVGTAEGLGYPFILELDPNFVTYTVEKLFGGTGQFLATPREVSKIEQRIMSGVVRKAFRELEDAWKRVHELHLREVTFESNAEFVQILPSMEPAMITTFEVHVQGHRTFLRICYPHLLLEKLLGRTGMQRVILGAQTEVAPQVRTRYEDTLRSMEVELRAELGRTRLSLQDIASLQEGDVIPLQRRTNEPLQVFIDKQEKFTAVAGTAGKQRALRILDATVQPGALDAPSLVAHDR